MTDPITGATTPTTTTTTSTTSSGASATTTSFAEDFDDFLTLLTAQLNNQDPLNPLDSTQFVEQLATFSGVEQQVNMNAKLDELIALSSEQELTLTDAASWVGREVQAESIGVDFDGESLTVNAPANASADEAFVVIRNGSGETVATLPASTDGGPVTWDGTVTEGGRAPAGLYDVEFQYANTTTDGGRVEYSLPLSSSGVVTEARLNGDEIELMLDSGAVTTLSRVSAIIG